MKKSMWLMMIAMTVLLFQNCADPAMQSEFDANSSSEMMSHLEAGRLEKSTGLSHVQYYGYYYGSTYLNEFKDHSNFLFVVSGAAQISDLVRQLGLAKENNMKAIVSIQDFLYETASTGSYRLRSRNDVIHQWSQIANVITSKKYENLILSFYIDEPEMYHRILQAKGYPSNYLADLAFIASLIRKSFPNAKLQMTSAWADISPNMVLPSSFDIFAFDCYNGWEKCGEDGHPNTRSVSEHLSILSSKVEALNARDGGSRSLFLIPPTFYRENHPSYPSKAMTLQIFPKYLDLARQNPLVKGIMPFMWQNHNPEMLIGARHFAEVRQMATDAGILIKGNNSTSVSEIKNPIVSVPPPAMNPVATPAPSPGGKIVPQPSIVNAGLGCDDKLCFWIIMRSATPSYNLYLNDPNKPGIRVKLHTLKDRISATKIGNGDLKITLRIPDSLTNVFKQRGLSLIFENQVGVSVRSTSQLMRPIQNSTAAPPINGPIAQPTAHPASSPLPDPRIVSQGLGCEDSLCIWFKVQNVATKYSIFLRDPSNYSREIKVDFSADKMTVRRMAKGELMISLRIPKEALAIFKNRGVDLVFVNLNAAEKKMTSVRVRP